MPMNDGRVLNPVEIEQGIVAAAEEVARSVQIVSDRLEAYREAEHLFDLKWAGEYMRATGPVEERKQTCVLKTEVERKAMDVAEVAFKYADRKCKAAEARLSAYQTLSRSITAMYKTAGVGEY